MLHWNAFQCEMKLNDKKNRFYLCMTDLPITIIVLLITKSLMHVTY